MGVASLRGALGRGGCPRLAGHPFPSVRSAVWGTPSHASLATTSSSTLSGGSKSVGGGDLLTSVLGGRAGMVFLEGGLCLVVLQLVVHTL